MPAFRKEPKCTLSMSPKLSAAYQRPQSFYVPKVFHEFKIQDLRGSETSFMSTKNKDREVTDSLLPGVSVLTMRAGKDTNYEERKYQIATTSPKFSLV